MKKYSHVVWMVLCCVTFAVGWLVRPQVLAPKSDASVLVPNPTASSPITQPTAETASAPERSSWLSRSSQDAAEIQAAARPGEVNSVLLRKMTANFYNGNAHEREPQWQALISLMRIEDAPAVKDLIEDFKKTQGRECLIEAKPFWYQWGKLAGAEALKQLPVTDRNGSVLASEALYGWATVDDVAALEWASTSNENFPSRQAALRAVLTAIGWNDPNKIEAVLLANSSDPSFSSFASQLAHINVYNYGMDRALTWFDGLSSRADLPNKFKEDNLNSLVNIAGQTSSVEALKVAKRYATQECFGGGAMDLLVSHYSQEDPEGGVATFSGISDAVRAAGAISLLGARWAARDPEGMSAWLASHPKETHYDNLVLPLVSTVSKSDPDAAVRWAETIHDQERRREVLLSLKGPDK